MDKGLLTFQAARNNAIWCDLVCSTHGCRGEFSTAYWHSSGPVPHFYPNLVTLQKDAAAVAAQLKKIQQEITAASTEPWSVKDSFNALDLQSLGFRRLFEADWIYRPARKTAAASSGSRLHWSKIVDPQGLAAWEQAWSGGASATADSQIFSAALLNRPDIAVLGAYRGNKLFGGVIANDAADVIGLSNLFGPALEKTAFWLEAVQAVQTCFPDLPLVGYEHGQDLIAAKEVGFEPLQPLAVWVRHPAQAL